MDYGRHLISRIVADGSLKEATTLGVSLEHFVSPEDRLVFEEITDHHQRYGRVPSVKSLRMDFPDYRFVKVDEPVAFLAERVRHAYRGATLEQMLAAAVEFYDDGQFEEAEGFLRATLRSLELSAGERLQPLDTETMLLRWREYRDNPPPSVPFGLKPIDDITRGIQKDDFVVLAGPPGSGKSALLLNMAIAAAENRLKTLFITIEMSDDHHMYRVAANRTGIPYKDIKFGPLTAEQNARVENTVRAIDKDGRFVVQKIEPRAASIGAIESLMDQHQPDIVYIDGAYLMDLPGVRNNAAHWEKLSALTREIRALILRRDTPIAITTQILRSKMQGGEVTSGSVGYSSSFEQDASVLLGIQPDAELDDRQVVKLLKGRDAPKISIHLHWEWEVMRFTIPGPGDEPDY